MAFVQSVAGYFNAPGAVCGSFTEDPLVRIFFVIKFLNKVIMSS